MAATRAATATDISSISDALVRAFDDDPVMNFLFRKHTHDKLRRFFVSDSKRALVKGQLHTTDDGVKGAAIWFGPGHWRIGGLEMLTQLPMMLRLGTDGPRSLAFLNQVEKAHPREPHWYLAVLGTEPEHQGKGIGSALLQPVLDLCDREGVPAYLESSKESNIPFYNRHGFVVRGEVTANGGPSVWPMWRDPRPPGDR